MTNIANISFSLDTYIWTSGVTDNFFLTPLGSISTPLEIEEVLEVEWTIIFDNIIYIIPIKQETQINYWFRIPEKYRNKILKEIETKFPFDEKKIEDRYLIAYSIENENEKFIGFIFESILYESKVSMFVFTQAKINTELEAREYLINYINIVNNKSEKLISNSILDKIFKIFKS